MGISPGDQVSRDYQSLFGEENMLYPGPPDVIETNIVFTGELTAALYDLRALDVLGWCEVIHHHDHFLWVEDSSSFNLLKLLNGKNSRQLRGQHDIDPGVDKLSRVNYILVTLGSQQLFGECKSHHHS
jgi:hypothetical protein